MFDAEFMQVALVASIAASAPLSVIGVYLILRRVVFLGLVLANAATVGAAVAEVFEWPSEIAVGRRRSCHRVGNGLSSFTTPCVG